MTVPIQPVPDPHDRIFDEIRQGRFRSDASAIRRSPPKPTARELGAQTMRGLGRSGISTAASAPSMMAALVGIPGVEKVIQPLVDKYFTEPEMASLDTYWGKPETGGGRGAALAGELLGMTALGAAAPAGEGPAPRMKTIPTIRTVLTDAEYEKVVNYLSSAKPNAPVLRVFEDMLGRGEAPGKQTLFQPERPVASNLPTYPRAVKYIGGEEDPTAFTPTEHFGELLGMDRTTAPIRPNADMSIADLEDLLNLRAFGKRKGPFNTSGKHAYDLEELPPIADLGEIADVRGAPPNRLDITEQMERQAPEIRAEMHAERLRENRANDALRDAITREGVPDFHQVMGFGQHTAFPVNPFERGQFYYQTKVQPRSLWQMLYQPKGYKQ